MLGHANDGMREFRDWRHRAEAVVQGIRAVGYILPGPFASPGRTYRVSWSPASPQKRRAAFDTELGDSLTELRFIVDNFKRDGAPRLPQEESAQAADVSPLAAPDKVTLKWLHDNVPVGLWWTALGVLVAAFLVGVTAGQFESVRNAIKVVFHLFS